MAISKIKITNFKSIGETLTVDFSQGVNILVGDNDVGKSTILEDQLKEANTHVRISNLPPSPMGFKYHHAQLIFTCNFVYDIQHAWEGVFTRNGSLLIKSSTACDAEAPARNPNDFEKGEL